MKARAITVGHSAMDFVYSVPSIPQQPTKVFATAYRECGGGMAANASVAMARLGAEVHYWGRIGDDRAGSQILRQLIDEGVGVATIRRMKGCASPTAAILVDPAGERLICVHNDQSFDADPSWLPLDSIARVDVVLTDVRWPEASRVTMRAANANGVITVFDGDLGDAAALNELCGLADYAIFSQGGLALASGMADPGRGLREVEKATRGVAAVTLGRDGVLWREHGLERQARPPVVQAIDTLAAGDVFHAAFALAIVEWGHIESAARFANAAAALKCTRFGGRLGAPTRAEVEAFLGRY
jgi:sugar/nucleoside kinase (ribokinase family)